MVNEQHDPTDPYCAEEIKVFQGLAHIRQRPSMYIGDVGQKGMHWIVFQLAANSLTESAQGFGLSLKVKLNTDSSVEVEDEGRSIDPSPHPTLGKPLLEALLTSVFAGSRSSGRDWLDYAVANALSEWLHVETRYEGQTYRQEYRRGVPVTPLRAAGTCSRSGVKVTFKPDSAIFGDLRFSFAVLHDRLREYAFLHSGMQITVSSELAGKEERFEFEDGIRSFVQHLNRGRQLLHPEVLVVRGEQAGVKYEVGLQWCREL